MNKKNRFLIFKCLIMLVLIIFLNFVYKSLYSKMCVNVSIMNYEYYKEEWYGSSKDNLRSFEKYYYGEENDDFFLNNCNYILIKDNVSEVKNYINEFLSKLQETDNTIDIDFTYDIITSNDYYNYSLNTEYKEEKLYYYDIDEHVLYVTNFY